MNGPTPGSRFEHFVAMDGLIQKVQKGVRGPSPVHAYLFCGPEGTGKRSLAAISARALNCQGPGDKPCDVCGSCKRYLAGTHPDHILVAGEKGPKGIKPITVNQIRQLIRDLSVRPYEGGRHTVIIERADEMKPPAQNALLKTLEEPPGSAVIFLLASGTGGLLPTVLSRVRTLRFAPLTEEDCARALMIHGIAPDRAALLARLSQGCVGQGLALDKDEEYWPLRDRVMKALSLLEGPHTVAQAFACLKDDKDRARGVLSIMEQTALYNLEIAQGAREGRPDAVPAPAKLLQGVIRTRRMLDSNVNWQYAMEMLFFELAAQAAGGSKQ